MVPAHDEAALIARCLDSLAIAARRAPVPVRIVVVCDSCTDATDSIARDAGAAVLTINAHSVGVARATGMAALLHGQLRGRWLATTDADSIVRADWLERQIALADAGADAVVGVVEIIEDHDHPPALISRYEELYAAGVDPDHPPTHHHVHGACLGMRATAYQAVGGFQHIPLHEDRELVSALESAENLHVVRTSDVVVRTSARQDVRAHGGFGTYLSTLATRNVNAVNHSRIPVAARPAASKP